jgi:molecular chaperone GrpE
MKEKHTNDNAHKAAPQNAAAQPTKPASSEKAAPEGEVPASAEAPAEASRGATDTVLADAPAPESEVQKVQSQLDALQDRYLRMLAEFDNYKRRTLRERDQLIESANASLMLDLVEVRENFERAIRSATEHGAADAVAEGMRLIFTKLEDVLAKNGLEPFAAEGEEFDPVLHDAMMKMPHERIPDGRIAQVLERGYRLKGNVLKHARVIVSAGAPQRQQTESLTDTTAAQQERGGEQ